VKCNSQTLRLRREQVLRLATNALGSDEAAEAWLRRPLEDGTKPDSLLDTTEGFQRVLEELESLGR
jgi:uncharacterized protein (DUF2384 family)